MIGLECLHTTAGISERSDVIRAFPKRSTSSCNFARPASGLEHEELVVTLTQVVETPVITADNSPSQDFTHPNDQTTRSKLLSVI